MSRCRTAAAAAVGAVLCGFAFLPVAAIAAKPVPPPQDVVVVNPVVPVEVSNAFPIPVVITNAGDIGAGGQVIGREPYNIAVEYSRAGCLFSCTNFVAFGDVLLFNGPAVPAGKRLIVLSVSGNVPSNNSMNSISFQDFPIISNQRAKWQFHGPFFAIINGVWGMTSESFFTVGPGESPHIRVRLGESSAFIASISISGYLIDAGP